MNGVLENDVMDALELLQGELVEWDVEDGIILNDGSFCPGTCTGGCSNYCRDGCAPSCAGSAEGKCAGCSGGCYGDVY